VEFSALAAEPFGLRGFWGVEALYSTTSGLDRKTAGDLLFQSATPTVLAKRSRPHFSGLSAQRYLVQDAADPRRGWGFFGEIGVSDGTPTPQDWAGLFGFGGTSPLPERATDRWGVAAFRNSISDEITRALRPARRSGEQGVKAFYNVAATPWLHVGADIRLLKPLFGASCPDALLATLRTNIRFKTKGMRSEPALPSVAGARSNTELAPHFPQVWRCKKSRVNDACNFGRERVIHQRPTLRQSR